LGGDWECDNPPVFYLLIWREEGAMEERLAMGEVKMMKDRRDIRDT
jgi:hypothetical protein